MEPGVLRTEREKEQDRGREGDRARRLKKGEREGTGNEAKKAMWQGARMG
jgi:hypothetical protein